MIQWCILSVLSGVTGGCDKDHRQRKLTCDDYVGNRAQVIHKLELRTRETEHLNNKQ